jgi:hypothetical protein
MKDTDAAWAAGFLDGEGSFGIYMGPTGWIKVTVQAAQVSNIPLLKLQEMFGGYIIPINRRRTARERDAFKWHLAKTSDLHFFLDAVTPYLVLKKAQAELIRVALNHPKANNNGIPEELLRERIALCEQMHALNRVGRHEE